HKQCVGLRCWVTPYIRGDRFTADVQFAAPHLAIGLCGTRSAAAAGERCGEQTRRTFHRALRRQPATDRETDAHGAEFPSVRMMTTCGGGLASHGRLLGLRAGN